MCSFFFSSRSVRDFDRINRLLKARGPDYTASGTIHGFSYIHNLLSLTGESTAQPLVDGDLVCLFNGEIYNFENLTAHTPSDVYAIVEGYKSVGPEVARLLDGEFAFVLLDASKQRLIISADVFRTKPLFYAIESGEIAIATYADAIKAAGFRTPVKFPANTTVVFDLASRTIEQKLEVKKFDLRQYKTSTDGWMQRFDDAVYKRVRYSRSKGFFIGLSSGYDSGAIACALAKIPGVNWKGYSVEATETPGVVAARLSLASSSDFIRLTKAEYQYYRDTLFKHRCEDFFCQTLGWNLSEDKACYGLAAVCQRAQADKRTIFLSGQGADEIISDYAMDGFPLYPQSNFSGVFPEDLESIFPWRNFITGTQEYYLAKEEYVAGAYGIEARYPFLDFDLVQEYLNLTAAVKNSRYKSVIHDYLKAHDYPFEENKKIGFQANKNLR